MCFACVCVCLLCVCACVCVSCVCIVNIAGVVGLRQLSPDSGAVLDLCSWGPNVMLYITQHGGVHAWDLRVKQVWWACVCMCSCITVTCTHAVLDICVVSLDSMGNSMGSPLRTRLCNDSQTVTPRFDGGAVSQYKSFRPGFLFLCF